MNGSGEIGCPFYGKCRRKKSSNAIYIRYKPLFKSYIIISIDLSIMPKLGIVLRYSVLAVLVLIFLIILLSFITQAGEKTIVDETIVLPSGSEKTYNLPPGMAYIEFQTNVPLDEHYKSLDGYGEGHGLMNDSQWVGSLFYRQYTIINNGTTDASVSLRITTGVLNPYTYI
jgi:hypothetical protein